MANNGQIVVLDFLPSPYGMRVRLALAAKGIEYEGKEEEDLMEGKSSLLLKMNTVHKKIPVLIHNGKPICESLIIMEYIDRVWKDKFPLLPSDPYQRAQAKFWAYFIDNKAAKGEKQEAAKKEFIESLKVLEGELTLEKLGGGGEKLGFLDIALIPLHCWTYTLETFGNFNIEAECPKIVTWGKRCMEEEFVSSSFPHPHKIYASVVKFMEKMGI